MKRSEEFHIVCSLRTTPQHRKDFSELLAALVEPARAEEGCLYYDVYQDRNDPDAFFILDGWKNQEAVDAHIKHPNVQKLNPRIRALQARENVLTFGRPIRAEQ